MTDFTNQKVNHQVFGPGTILEQCPLPRFCKPCFNIQFSDDQKLICVEDFENLASFVDPVFQQKILNIIQQKNFESMFEDFDQPHTEINLDEIFANLPEEFGLNDLIAQVVLQKMKKENQDLKDIL